MKILGLVLEANPFHNGHKYFVEESIKKIKPDLVIAITSTSFTMRGEVSLLNKFDKTKVLLDNNIDIILELPFTQGVQSANQFCKSCILNLEKIGITDLAFGCETEDISLLNKYVNIISSDEFNDLFKHNKTFNYSFKETYTNTLNSFLTSEEINLFNRPNVTLAIQYLKTIKENNLHIKPHIIKRIISDYDDNKIVGSIASATSIRYAINNNLEYNKTLPRLSKELLINYHQAMNNFLELIKYEYKLNKNFTSSLIDPEGINNYIEKNGDFTSLEKLQNSLKNKRYSVNRINRNILYSLLNINDIPAYCPYLRILGVSNKGLQYIHSLDKNIKANIFAGNKEIKNQNNLVKTTYEYELRATKLYSIITNNEDLITQESILPLRKENI